MNKTVGQDILTNIEKELDILNKESAEHVARSSFTDIVSKLESDDITVQTHLYNDLVTMSCSSAVERLRQRAMMMRQRADEFDATADKMVKDQKNLEEISYALNKLYLTVEKLIADHAHIKPTETR